LLAPPQQTFAIGKAAIGKAAIGKAGPTLGRCYAWQAIGKRQKVQNPRPSRRRVIADVENRLFELSC
jgi:hypothetical protein